MKNSNVLLLTAFVVISACQNNKLKQNENDLVEAIFVEELEKENSAAILQKQQEEALAKKLANTPKGYRFKEERGVNIQNPPLVIDVAGQFSNQKQVKLSEVASSIRYIKMEALPDKSIPNNMPYKYYLLDDYIIASNLYGIHQYSNNGRFIKTIVKNELTGVDYNESTGWVSIRFSHTKIGGGTNVWARGNKLFYTYSNGNTGQELIMELDCSKEEFASNQRFNPENKNAINALGEISIDMNPSNILPEKPKNSNGMWMADVDALYHDLTTFSLDKNTYIKKQSNLFGSGFLSNGSVFLNVLSSGGDTLSSFKKYEKFENYARRKTRGVDYDSFYEKGGDLFFRTAYNDTVFKIIPPNRIEPCYVLNLGQYKLSMQDGMTPGASLQGKIVPQEFIDTKDFLFLTFTKDSYDCPGNRRDHSLKLYYAIYSKTTKELSIVNKDTFDYQPQVIQNNIDGGMPVWPKPYMIGSNGEVLISKKGMVLKNYLASEQFINADAPMDRKDNLKRFAASLNADDDVLIIVQ